MRILAGDIGGTNIRLATYASGALSAVETTSNTGQTSVDEALSRYFATHGPFDGIGLGVAGPLRGDVITMTNQAVRLDVESLTSRFECPVRLVNDFHAQAVAMPHLSAEDRVALGPHAEPIPGHYAVLGAGTGLGEAFLIWTGTAHVAVAGEGSHGRFAPKTPREFEVLTAFMKRWPDHVSVERVVSGAGMVDVYDVLRGDRPRPEAMEHEDPAAVITRLGREGTCPIAVETLHLFVDTLADEAASLALKCNASTVFIAGGIPPRILPVMEARFRKGFEQKGRYRGLMETMATFVVTHPQSGLLGAAQAWFERSESL